MNLNRTIAPHIKDAVDYPLSLKPYSFFRLSNGVEVYTVDAGPQDVIQLEFVFDAGNAYEDQNLVAASTNYLLKNGTTSKSAFAINEHFEYYGAYLNRSTYTETSTVTLHSMTKHLPELLPVLRELISDAVFPQEELDIYRQNMKQRLSVNLKKSEFVAGRLMGASLSGRITLTVNTVQPKSLIRSPGRSYWLFMSNIINRATCAFSLQDAFLRIWKPSWKNRSGT